MLRWTALLLTLGLVGGAWAAEDKDGPKPAREDPLAEAKVLAAEEDWDAAIERFRDFLDKHPDDPQTSEARYLLGNSLAESGDHEAAIKELTPFESTLAKDKWADRALLQLGHAYRGNDQDDLALAAWKRLLENYPASEQRGQALIEIIDLLHEGSDDHAACLAYCERAVKEFGDTDDVFSKARYIGAYCLNALRRFEEADRWIDQKLAADEPLHAAWSQVLGAQRAILEERADAALAELDDLFANFPDLDADDRIDLIERVAHLLRKNQHADRARDLVLTALKGWRGSDDSQIEELLDALAEVLGDGQHEALLNNLAGLTGDAKVPALVRVVARARRVQVLRADDHPEQAESLLREALASEKTDYARYRAATLLAELLDDRGEDEAALKVLVDLSPTLHRRDLIQQVGEELKERRSPLRQE